MYLLQARGQDIGAPARRLTAFLGPALRHMSSVSWMYVYAA